MNGCTVFRRDYKRTLINCTLSIINFYFSLERSFLKRGILDNGLELGTWKDIRVAQVC